MTEGRHCKRDGSLQAQEVLILKLPYVVQAALMKKQLILRYDDFYFTHTIDPEYHKELYSAVIGARYGGYANSETIIGAEFAANVKPKPIRKLHW